jgi:hypothetical protein
MDDLRKRRRYRRPPPSTHQNPYISLDSLDARQVQDRQPEPTDPVPATGFAAPWAIRYNFELAGDVSVEVGFALTEEEAQKLLALLAGEKLRMFYIRVPLEMGFVGAEE